MIIQHNISAMGAYNKLSKNQSALAKNLQKLSSGYKVNTAADDAAGLAVSEKMRAIITGTDRAEENCNEGISLLQTGEGALQEVHDMLNRLKELAVQSSNGTYDNEVDRNSLQKELEQLRTEVDRIITSTNFNNVELFQNEGLDFECSKGSASTLASELLGFLDELEGGQQESPKLTLGDLLANKSGKFENIIYTETVFDYEAAQSTSADDATSITDPTWQSVANTLKGSIVPQVVSKIMDTYPAFSFLDGSSVGIGLRLYSENSTTLASVGVSTGWYDYGNRYEGAIRAYTLSVNMNSVGDLSDPKNRNALEQTIAHEMIHAFMDETMTTGMTGLTESDVTSRADEFPYWFVEGMAQTASGPGNWTRASGGLNINPSSSDAQITASLSSANNRLGSTTADNAASAYGTGYLACMYLGYLASGSTADMSDPTAAAATIADGVSEVLADIVYGDSLDQAIKEATNGRYTTTAAFEAGFASDQDAIDFIRELLAYTSTAQADGNVAGGLLSGSLTATDPVGNADISGVKLFELDTDHTKVTNDYRGTGVTVFSGGGTTISGTPAVDTITDPDLDDAPATYINPFTISGGAEGVDWSFDTDTGTLTILTDTAMTISGGTKTDNGTTYYGTIAVAGDANLTLNGVNIDATRRGDGKAGIQVGYSSTVTIDLVGNNTIKGDDGAAGIGTAKSANASASTIYVSGSGSLNVTGGSGAAAIGSGSYGSVGDVIIYNGNITATGGAGAAAIGSGEHGTVDEMVIVDGSITATGGAGAAAIGTGKNAAVGAVTFAGGSVTAKGGAGAAGIGSGEDATLTSVRINGGTITATGGTSAAGIGSGLNGNVADINICNDGTTVTATGGTNAAGIGSGSSGDVGVITIKDGTTVTATGGTNAAAIGGGSNGATVAGVFIGESDDTCETDVTAVSGRADGKYAIGGYTNAAGTAEASVTIEPTKTSIKAGSGEGKDNVQFAVDSAGEPLYALKLSYLNELLQRGDLTLTADGTDAASLSFPLEEITVVNGSGTMIWSNMTGGMQHFSENDDYVWLTGEDITITVRDADGTEGTVDLKFFADEELFRYDESDLPVDPPVDPDEPVDPDAPVDPGDPNDPPSTPQEPKPPVEETTKYRGIVLQVGANSENTFEIPKFYLSREALGLDALDISTQDAAMASIDMVGSMINRISEIRGSYGALQNGLEHTINNLNINMENLSAAESQIRDTDMAEEMMKYTKNNILIQSAQAMLAQANTLPQGVLQLLQ